MMMMLMIQVYLIGRLLSLGMTPCSVVKRYQHLEEPTYQTTLSYPRRVIITVSALKPQTVYPMQQVMAHGHARKEKVKGSSNVVGVLLNVKAVEKKSFCCTTVTRQFALHRARHQIKVKVSL